MGGEAVLPRRCGRILVVWIDRAECACSEANSMTLASDGKRLFSTEGHERNQLKVGLGRVMLQRVCPEHGEVRRKRVQPEKSQGQLARPSLSLTEPKEGHPTNLSCSTLPGVLPSIGGETAPPAHWPAGGKRL